MRVRGESAAVATESDGSVAGSRARAASASRKGSRKKAFELKGFAGSPDDVCTDVAYAVDLRADPPTTVSELSKVLGVADREGYRAGRDSPRPRPRPAPQRELKLAMAPFSKQAATGSPTRAAS